MPNPRRLGSAVWIVSRDRGVKPKVSKIRRCQQREKRILRFIGRIKRPHFAHPAAMEFHQMYGMPFAPLGQISTNAYYGGMPQQSVGTYYPGVVSYGMPYGSQPIMSMGGGGPFLPSITSNQTPMFYTQQPKSNSFPAIASPGHIIMQKKADVIIDQSKENIDSNSDVGKPQSEESTLRYLLKNNNVSNFLFAQIEYKRC